MRLLDATTLEIVEFLSEDKIPPFAILSHTWEDEECTLQQFQDADSSLVRERKGYQKIQQCCKQALADDLQWAWVDTCCIDKTSTAELSEAINSMFRWYQIAKVCYAFLSDTTTVASLPGSRWFTRGWTLQELVAPADVRFYNDKWEFLGTKLDLKEELHEITTIEEEILGTGVVGTVSIARRMAWAAKRQTTRIEDRAYSLMGIFDVNMPLLYGEGVKAFTRLQESIMKMTDDQSLFAWGVPPKPKTAHEFCSDIPSGRHWSGIFAESPADFELSSHIYALQDLQSAVPPIVSNNGVRIELQVYQLTYSWGHRQQQFAVLYCTMVGNYKSYLGFPIEQWGKRWVARCGELVTIAVSDLVDSQSMMPYTKPEVLLMGAPVAMPKPPAPWQNKSIAFVQASGSYSDLYVSEVICATHAEYSDSTRVLTLSHATDALHAIFVFSRIKSDRDNILLKGKRSPADFPTFAVLVGGTVEAPWVYITLVFDHAHAEADFRRLYKPVAESVQHCATKGQVLAMLENNVYNKPPRSERDQSAEQLIMFWPSSQSLRGRSSKRAPGQGQLMVKAQIGTIWTNLVELGVTLLVTIGPEDSEDHKAALEELKWWSIQDGK